MTTEVEETQESGAAFRAKFESTQAENKALRELYASTYKYVKADDLSGVEPTQFATKAQEIETSRKAEREALAKEFLAERGVPEEQLDTVLSTLAKPAEQATVTDDAASRIASLGQLGGTPIQRQPDTGLYGESRIDAALAAE